MGKLKKRSPKIQTEHQRLEELKDTNWEEYKEYSDRVIQLYETVKNGNNTIKHAQLNLYKNYLEAKK